MDPNADLIEQERTLGLLVIFSGEHINVWRRRVRHDAARLTELRQALYDWIRDGGFEPDWTLGPYARKYYGR